MKQWDVLFNHSSWWCEHRSVDSKMSHTKVSCNSQLYSVYQAIYTQLCGIIRMIWVKFSTTRTRHKWPEQTNNCMTIAEVNYSYTLPLGGAQKHLPGTILCFEENEVTRLLPCFLGFSHKHSKLSLDFILVLCSNNGLEK